MYVYVRVYKTPHVFILWGEKQNGYGSIPLMEWLTSISGGVLYKLSTVQAKYDFLVMSVNHSICRVVLCLYGSTVTV